MLLDSHFTASWQVLGSGTESRGMDRLFYSSQGSLHMDSQLCELTKMMYGCHGEGMKPYILVDLHFDILGGM